MKQKEHLPFFGIGPFYVGVVVLMTVAGMILSSRGCLDSGLISWWLMAVMMKHTEEKWLHELYGKEYDEYCHRVNRTWPWVPKKKYQK